MGVRMKSKEAHLATRERILAIAKADPELPWPRIADRVGVAYSTVATVLKEAGLGKAKP